MSAPRRVAGVLVEEVPGTGEYVLLDRERGRVLALNASASAVWELIDGRRGPRELAEVLASATGVDRDEAERDVVALLARLRGEGFLSGEA